MTSLSPVVGEPSNDTSPTTNLLTRGQKLGAAALFVAPIVVAGGASYALDHDPLTVMTVIKHAAQGVVTSVGACSMGFAFVLIQDDECRSVKTFCAGLVVSYVFGGLLAFYGVHGSPHQPTTHTPMPSGKNRVVASPETPLTMKIDGKTYRCEPAIK